MSTTPFFTIGVPVYNTEKYIAECMDSILKQDFVNYEIICVNDGSTDKSLSILTDYAQKDSRVKVIDRENSGLTAVRNTVFMYARGEYICMIDSDDLMAENALSNAYNHILKNNYPDVLHTGNRQFYDSDTKRENVKYLYHPYPGDEYFVGISKDERSIKLLLDNKLVPNIWIKYFKKEFIQKNGLVFDLRCSLGEDNAFSVLLYRKLNTIVYSDFINVYYRLNREGSIMTSPSAKSWHTLMCYEYGMYNDSKFYNLTDETRRRLYKRKLEFSYRMSQHLLARVVSGMPEKEIFDFVDLAETYFEDDLKAMPLPGGASNIIYWLFKVIGVRKTIKIRILLYKILKR